MVSWPVKIFWTAECSTTRLKSWLPSPSPTSCTRCRKRSAPSPAPCPFPGLPGTATAHKVSRVTANVSCSTFSQRLSFRVREFNLAASHSATNAWFKPRQRRRAFDLEQLLWTSKTLWNEGGTEVVEVNAINQINGALQENQRHKSLFFFIKSKYKPGK